MNNSKLNDFFGEQDVRLLQRRNRSRSTGIYANFATRGDRINSTGQVFATMRNGVELPFTDLSSGMGAIGGLTNAVYSGASGWIDS